MSSVNNSSSKAAYEEKIRSLKEEYKKREAELAKKHSQEVKKLSQNNVAAIDHLKTQNAERMGEVKTKTRESISRRDAKYQKEIEDLKKFHSRQLERMMKESDSNLQSVRAASKGETRQAKISNEARAQDLHSKYGEVLASKTDTFNQAVENMREEQKRSYDEMRSDLQKKHESERQQLQDSYTQQLAELRGDLSTTRANSRQRLKAQEQRHMNDRQRMESGYMSEILNREAAHADLQEGLRKGYAETLNKLRDRQKDVSARQAERANQVRDNFASEVNERLSTREMRLERKLADEASRNVREESKVRREARGEVMAWRDEYQKKYESLEDEKRAAFEQAQKSNAKDIQRVRDESNDILARSHSHMQQTMDTDYLKSRSAISSLENDLKTKVESEKLRADTRIEDLMENTYSKEERLKRVYEENLSIMKRKHEDEVREMRIGLIEDKDTAVQSVKERAQEKELVHQRQIEDTVKKYEKRIAELNDQFVREKRLRDNRERQLVESLKKASDSEKEAIALKYAEINKQANVEHQKEMREVSERHKNQVDHIMTIAKKT